MSQPDVWLEGWLSGDMPTSELEPFQDWLRSDPQHRRTFLTVVALDQDLRAAYRSPRTLSFRSWRPLAMVASVAALVLIGVGVVVWNAAVVAPLPPARVVSGWALSEGLILEEQAAPIKRSRITSPQAGELKRGGSLVRLQPGAEIVLDGTGNDLRLAAGRLSVTLESEPEPQPFGSFRVETTCGTIVLVEGTRLEMSSESLHAPTGETIQRVEVFVLAGSIIPPALRPMPAPPLPMEAGSAIRLTRTGEGPVTMTPLPAP